MDRFQSSPLSQEGRYGSVTALPNRIRRFQSSPLSQEGRYVRQLDVDRFAVVSILAPLARGALHPV